MTDRNTYIGSSDAKRILDGDWFMLWQEKTGRVEREDLTDKFKVQLGIFTEGFHLDWTIRRAIEKGEIACELPKSRQVHLTPADGPSYILAHADTLIARDMDKPADFAPMEVKHSSGKRTMEDLYTYYMPQLQHLIWCAGSEHAVLSVIQGNEEPERVWIGRSDEWISTYAAACKRFWHYIEKDVAPPMNSPPFEAITPKMADAVPVNGKVRVCMDESNEFISLARDYVEGEKAAKAFDATKKKIKGLMKPEHGELYSRVLTMKRDARGAIRFTVHEEEAAK